MPAQTIAVDYAAHSSQIEDLRDELIEAFEFKRLVEAGDEVIVTYESTKTDGRRFRNTEVLTFEGDKICRAEVYFGWDLE